jgi:hypothetical protein
MFKRLSSEVVCSAVLYQLIARSRSSIFSPDDAFTSCVVLTSIMMNARPIVTPSSIILNQTPGKNDETDDDFDVGAGNCFGLPNINVVNRVLTRVI